MSEAKLTALYNRLMAAGCNWRYLSIQGTAATGNDDVERLENDNGEWIIAYWERGQRRSILYRSFDLDDAISHYEECIGRIRHDHCIATSQNISEIEALETELTQQNIAFRRTDWPKNKPLSKRTFRLYVVGKEIFKVEHIYERTILIGSKN